MLSARERPIASFILDLVEGNKRHGRDVTEGPRVSFVPKLPNDQHGDRSNRLTSHANSQDVGIPPLPYRVDVLPRTWVELSQPQPIPNHQPNADREFARKKNMRRDLRFPLAELTYTAIRPTMLLQPVCGPNSVVEHDPCKKLAFGGRPVSPHRRIYGGGN